MLAIGMMIAAAVCWPGAALAQKGGKQTVAGLIKKGEAFYDDQRYEESIQTLSAALLRPEISKGEKLAVYKLLAFDYILLGKNEEADGAVRGLLVTDESFALPTSESPRFRDFFTDAKKKWVAEGKPGLKADATVAAKAEAVKIKHASPAQVKRGTEIRLTGEIEDPEALVARVRLYYRHGSTGKYKSVRVKYAVRKFSVEIPSAAVEPPLVEYYLEALDEKGMPVGTRGDADTPLRVAVPERGSIIKSPWLWVPVSIAVVAAIVIPVAIVASRTRTASVTVVVSE
jgi:hypothetical protein